MIFLMRVDDELAPEVKSETETKGAGWRNKKDEVPEARQITLVVCKKATTSSSKIRREIKLRRIRHVLNFNKRYVTIH